MRCIAFGFGATYIDIVTYTRARMVLFAGRGEYDKKEQ
jgi:hypothetical protein